MQEVVGSNPRTGYWIDIFKVKLPKPSSELGIRNLVKNQMLGMHSEQLTD